MRLLRDPFLADEDNPLTFAEDVQADDDAPPRLFRGLVLAGGVAVCLWAAGFGIFLAATS